MNSLRTILRHLREGEALPLTVRAAVVAVCALALLAHLGGPALQVTGSLAALAGVLLGHRLGASPLRGWVLGLAAALAMALSATAGALITRWAMPAALLGPAGALTLATGLRVVLPLGMLVLALRALGRRHGAVAALELAGLVAAVAGLLASHRDGSVLRPLWFSDLAASMGWRPTSALMAVGGACAVGVALLPVLESRRRIHLSTLLALPLLAILAWASFQVSDLPRPDNPWDLGINDRTDSKEWNPSEEGMPQDGNGEGDEGRDGDRPDDERDGQGGGQPRDADGQGGGQNPNPPGEQNADGEGGQPPPPPPPQPPDFNSRTPQSSRPQPLAVVILSDDWEPPEGAWYFRQESWSEFNGSRLIPTRRRLDRDGLDRFPATRTGVDTLPPTQRRQLVRTTVAILTDHNRPFGLTDPIAFAPSGNPDPTRFRRAWDVESLAPDFTWRDLATATFGNPAWSNEERAHYLALPGDPRYQVLAQEILETLPETAREVPVARALAIKQWLDRNVIYSLRHQHTGGRDPTARFLFGDRTGYCVHNAHAAVFLMRALGIPSRISAGYMVPAENRRGANLVLHSSDAHAWPEVWVQGWGWVVLDIHPQQIADEPMPPLDEEMVDELGEIARRDPDLPPIETLEERPSLVQPLLALLRWLVPRLLAALVAALYLIRLWRRVAVHLATEADLPRVAYRASLDLLADAGLRRRIGESREAFAARLAARLPAFQTLTTWHLAAGFGPATLRAPGRPPWLDTLRDLRSQLRATTPRARRWLGPLPPWTFLLSR
jgi:transglutaminase-like putative cysteine protease